MTSFHISFQAKEVAIMTGVALKLKVRDEHYDSVVAGHAKEGPYEVIYFSIEIKVVKCIVCCFIKLTKK